MSDIHGGRLVEPGEVLKNTAQCNTIQYACNICLTSVMTGRLIGTS